MQEIDFLKAQGIGNDFIIIDALDGGPTVVDLPELAVHMCDRNFGVGADGLILVLPSDIADYCMRIINSDGSEAEMCGNGIRCFARYLFDRGLGVSPLTIETMAGVKVVEAVEECGEVTAFTVNMGAPRLDARDIPINDFEGRVIAQPLEVDGVLYEITCVSMGNPHCVIFVDSTADVPLEKIGPKIEHHPAFPKKTNVEFIQVLGQDEINFRVWERGAGPTLACGTGASAAVVAGALNGRLNRKTTVHLPGGDLQIDWREDGNVYMTGPAEVVFIGKYGM
jgi:diaminopimelate epimerase